MQPVNYGSLPAHTEGDTWEGILSIGPITFYGAAPTSALSSCEIDFRKNGVFGYRLSTAPGSGEGAITISNSATWVMTIAEQALPLTAGVWDWDMETIDAGSRTRTVLKGTIEITRNQRHD